MKKIINAGINDGGKAYGLSLLSSGGFNIPDGFVINERDIQNIIAGKTEEFEGYLSAFEADDKFAVRSSAFGEDGEKNSFAGIFETKLDVENDLTELTEAIKYVRDSSEGAAANSYDENNSHSMNIVIQRMIHPVLSGVAFSNAVEETGDDVVRIEAVEGLAEKLVSGRSSSSVITVKKSDIFSEEAKIQISGKAFDYSKMQDLAREVYRMEKYFKKEIDTEWCIDENGVIFFVQARPVTRTLFISNDRAECIVASSGHAEGTIFVIDENWDELQTVKQLENLPENAVLAAWATDTRHMPLMKKAAAVITEEGTALSHAAIISRELGIPCITGYKKALDIFQNGKSISLDTRNGIIRYDGKVFNFNKKKLLDFADIYDFEKIAEVSIEGRTILFQHSFNGVIMCLPYRTSSYDEEKYELAARKLFGCQTLRCSVCKYEWYFIYKDHKKLPYFNGLCVKLKDLCSCMNTAAIEKFYIDTEEFLKNLVSDKEKYDPYDRVLAEEIMLSLHILVDMVIPNGYAVCEVYYKVFSYLANLDIAFEDMIAGNFPSDREESQELIKAKKFIEKVSILRNEISTKLLACGAISYDMLLTRNDRMKKGLKHLGVEVCEEEVVFDLFYEKLVFSDNVKELMNKVEGLIE